MEAMGKDKVLKFRETTRPDSEEEPRFKETGTGDRTLDCTHRSTQCDLPLDRSILTRIIKQHVQLFKYAAFNKYQQPNEVTCISCKAFPVYGDYYECITCEEYLLCEVCEYFGHEHPMVKHHGLVNDYRGIKEKLETLGFEHNKIHAALIRHNDYQAAVEYLLFDSL